MARPDSDDDKRTNFPEHYGKRVAGLFISEDNLGYPYLRIVFHDGSAFQATADGYNVSHLEVTQMEAPPSDEELLRRQNLRADLRKLNIDENRRFEAWLVEQGYPADQGCSNV